MEPSSDLFSDWAVVEVTPRVYIGRLPHCEPDANGFIRLHDGFEVVIARMNAPGPDGSVTMMQHNLSTPFPLCAGPEPTLVKPMAIRWVREMSDDSRREHIAFIEAAKKNFLEARMARVNLQPATASDLANLARSRRA